MVKTWNIPRAAQDELALESHRHAAAAWSAGFFDDLVIEYEGLKTDNNIRADTSLEKLAKLRPTFDLTGSGSLTAGNSTPLTDGAAAVPARSEEWAAARKLRTRLSALRQNMGGGFRNRQGGPADGTGLRRRAMLRDAGLACRISTTTKSMSVRCASAVHARRVGVTEYCRDVLGEKKALAPSTVRGSTSKAEALRSTSFAAPAPASSQPSRSCSQMTPTLNAASFRYALPAAWE